ncbi:DUF222 domain-containing protein [Cellulomonas sp. McL0617]|uniref:HNH endonuclease signature motif containing protein n=1 Tax=Cellulomonas sp. McL0617 TaxID=3415675 RepID=UPI003CF2984E
MTNSTTNASGPPTPSHPVHGVLAELAASVEALAGLADPTVAGRLDGADAAGAVREALMLAGRLSAVAARLVPVVEADGWWALDGGGGSITSWVAATGRLSHGQARRMVTLGRAFRDDLPIAAGAAVEGVIGLESAHALASVTTTPARRSALSASAEDCGEEFLVDHARELPVGRLRMLARRWAARADPAADERGYREADEREFLDLADTTDGCHLAGFLTTEHGHALRAALDAMTKRTAEHAGQPAGRKRARALTNLVRTVLDRDLTGATGAHRPHITAVVDFETLTRAVATRRPGQLTRTVGEGLDAGGDGAEAAAALGAAAGAGRSEGGERASTVAVVGDTERFGVAELIGTGPIPDSVLARLACDSQITRVVFGPQSQVLNVGRTERTYGGHKRRAIIARDLHCRYPGCDAPPAMSEIHHVEHWVRDSGETNVETGCLLCWAHHESVHDAGIEIRRDDGGRWRFTDRHGQPLRAP